MRKIRNILLLIIVFCLVGSVNIYAAGNGIVLQGEDTAKASEEKVLDVKLQAEEDIGGVQFNIEYSDNIEIKSITSGNSDWTVMYTDSEKLVTAYTGMDGHKSTGFAKINYTVKADATGSAAITLKNITVTNTIGEKTTVTGNVVKTVVIGEGTPGQITKTLTGIAITTKPTKTSYTEGESFDKTGMVLTATYSDGTSNAVTGYSYTPNGKLKAEDTKITISYTEGNVTKTIEQAIKVTKVTTSTTENVVQKDPTVANKVISKTGVTNTVVISIIAIAVIGIVAYIKYRGYKEV